MNVNTPTEIVYLFLTEILHLLIKLWERWWITIFPQMIPSVFQSCWHILPCYLSQNWKHYDIVPKYSVSLSAALLICYEWILTVSPQVVVCEESTEGVELQLLSGTHIPHHRPLSISLCLPPSSFPFAMHQIVSHNSQSRGDVGHILKRRETIWFHIDSLSACSSRRKQQKKIL